MPRVEHHIGTRVFLPEVEAPLNQPHPEQVGRHGVISSYELIYFLGHGVSTPVITLDNGDIIRGYECWWEPEADG